MEDNIFFKGESINEEMSERYLLYELRITKKFKKIGKEISWADTKKYVFEIIKEISEKNLFKNEARAPSLPA